MRYVCDLRVHIRGFSGPRNGWDFVFVIYGVGRMVLYANIMIDMLCMDYDLEAS